MSFGSDFRKVLAALVGLSICCASGYLGWVVVHTKPLDAKLIYFAGGGIFLGALLIPSIAPRLMAAAKQLVSLLPSIKIGGGSPPSP